jgi:hypothetical protein
MVRVANAIHVSCYELGGDLGDNGVTETMKQYVITEKQTPTDDPAFDHALDLELTIDGPLAVGLLAHVTSDAYSDSWHHPFVTAFIPGPWKDDVK